LNISFQLPDIIEEITTELTIPDEKESFNFATYQPKCEKQDEDLWCPRKVTSPKILLNPEDTYGPPQYPTGKPTETLVISIPSVMIYLEIEDAERVPVLMMKVSITVTI
jgi:hypothetical protein